MSSALSQTDDRTLNEVLFDKLASHDPDMRKEALDAVDDFTRTKMREDGFFRTIMPPITITNDDLDRQVGTSKPVKIVDKEPDSPAAVSVPFATLPTNFYIQGDRYAVMFDRIQTNRFTKDVSELRTWMMDIRQVFSDNSIKDMLAEEDGKFMTAVNTAVGGSQGATVPTSGVVQWQAISGGITRDTLFDAMKIQPQTPSNLEVHTVLVNHITIKDILKFDRTEAGGDLSENLLRDGWSLETFLGVRWVVTIKRSLVPTNTMFTFADPKFIGKHYELEAATTYIERKFYLIEFFTYEEIGATIGHTSGLSRIDFE